MLIDITRMWSNPGDTIVFGEGFNIEGNVVTFAGDRRPMVQATEMWKADVMQTIEETGDPEAGNVPLLLEIDDWQVIEVQAKTTT